MQETISISKWEIFPYTCIISPDGMMILSNEEAEWYALFCEYLEKPKKMIVEHIDLVEKVITFRSIK